MWCTKFLRGFIFADWQYFVFCGNSFFWLGPDWFSLLGINFCDFQKVPSTQHWLYFRFYWVRAIEIHISKQKNSISLFLNERGKLWLNRHDFVVLYFCVANLIWRIFTLGLIFTGKVCAIIFICGNLFLWIAGKNAKIAKIWTRKNFLPQGASREEECLLLKISKNLLHVFSKLGYA